MMPKRVFAKRLIHSDFFVNHPNNEASQEGALLSKRDKQTPLLGLNLRKRKSTYFIGSAKFDGYESQQNTFRTCFKQSPDKQIRSTYDASADIKMKELSDLMAGPTESCCRMKTEENYCSFSRTFDLTLLITTSNFLKGPDHNNDTRKDRELFCIRTAENQSSSATDTCNYEGAICSLNQSFALEESTSIEIGRDSDDKVNVHRLSSKLNLQDNASEFLNTRLGELLSDTEEPKLQLEKDSSIRFSYNEDGCKFNNIN